MRFGLLGSLQAHDGAQDCPIRGPKARTLLAVLLLNANQPVSLDRLIDALWGDETPNTAEASLRNLVARTRKSLGDDTGERLRAVPSGYQLLVKDEELDSARFELAVQRARAAHEAADWPRVLAETATALELWRGEPLADLPETAAGHSRCEQWRENRLQALEWRFDAELHQGRPHGLVAELTRLVGEHPLREAFHGQLMLALHGSGQRAQALTVYQRLRRALVDELGIEPGPAVRESHARILADQPEPAPAPTPRTGRPIPAQLPSPPPHFVGRREQLDALRTALLSGTDRPGLAVLSGMAGVGKSALAVHCAETLRGRFPDGQLFLNLRGATPGLTPLGVHQALTALLRGLGTGPADIPDEADGAAALLRSTLSGTRTLLLLDDAADLAQVRHLLPSGPGCGVLITSRTPMLALDGATHLRLGTLTSKESIALVELAAGRATAGREVVSIEHADLARLVELCGRLPLALRIVAARLAARATLPVRNLADRLEDPEDRLDELELDDLSVRQSLGLAHDALRGSDRKLDRRAADALAAVGALDLPEYSAGLLSGVLRISPGQAGAALDRLADIALLDEPRSGLFVPHDLVRDYARELTADPAERDRSVAAALHWYLDAAAGSARVLDPGLHRKRQLPPGHGHDDDRDTAFAFGDNECANLTVLVERLADQPWAAPQLLTLVQALPPFLRARGRTPELLQLNEIALRVARREQHSVAEGIALVDLATAHTDTGRFTTALDLVDRAIPLWRRTGHLERLQTGLNNRATILQLLGRDQEAADTLHQALDLAVRNDDAFNEAFALSTLGNLAEADDPHLAITHHTRSIDAGRRTRDPVLFETAGLCNIGNAHLRLDQPAEALHHYRTALARSENTHWNTKRECRLGEIESLRRLRRLQDAADRGRELLALTTELADTYGTGLAEHAHGLVLRDQGLPHQALTHWRAALDRLSGTDNPIVAELRGLITFTEATAGVA
ncbi:BTAD domain-containing putative transcriptional regulator [Kitasatospora sp. NPDC004272]